MLIVQARPGRRDAQDEAGNEVAQGGVAFGCVYVFDVSQTDGVPLPIPTEEVEAESLAFIVAHAARLDTSKASFRHVTRWAGARDAAAAVASSGERITRAADVMLGALYDGAGAVSAEAA